MPSVCLTMIVRDEAEWICSCLQSAIELGISSWVIADTGSVDDTRPLIREKLTGIPGELVELEWEGFGPARSEVLRRARGQADLILMLDADMIVHGDLPKRPFAEAYNVAISSERLEYALPLLTRGDLVWCYRGPAHSFLAEENGAWHETADCELWVEDRRAGGWRPGKLEDDARLFEAALEQNPHDARSSFYLAQTYANLDRVGDAIREYGRRILMQGYAEERYVAMLRRARLIALRDPKEAISSFLEAWQYRPMRAEALYAAARQARISGWDDLALLFARRAAGIAKPEKAFFQEGGVYAWGIDLELGIAELRAGEREAGLIYLRDLRESGRATEAVNGWIDELLAEEREEAMV